ncbi:MAG TPA: acylphosphatase, partial [Thermoanaerobaculia bacterium]|nr:acylphosphatase [Thermoanaerobaculia bacterium]
MIARRAILSGRVQGVGFRFFAERAAREAGVTGWVR